MLHGRVHGWWVFYESGLVFPFSLSLFPFSLFPFLLSGPVIAGLFFKWSWSGCFLAEIESWSVRRHVYKTVATHCLSA